MSPLTPGERAEAAVCAEVLATGVYWWAAGLVFAGLTAFTSLLAGPRVPVLWPALTLVLAVTSTWVASRVLVDVGLFRALARDASPYADLKALDVALVSLMAVRLPQPAGERGVADRARGALRWWRGGVMTSLCQASLWLAVCWQTGRAA